MKDITISKTNPRKTFDEKSLQELSESIKLHGILQPILIRPKGKKYELVCGERRYKAAKEAGVIDIPSNIRSLTDDEAFELQIIENLERKDVHPLEEADAFKIMLESGKYQIQDISAKIAKTESFVLGRLKLVDLIFPIRMHFKKGYLGIGHATLIAKCNPEQQADIYSDAKAYNEEDEPDYGTYKRLKENIEDDTLNLKDAVFSLETENLIKGVCSCYVCPKRSKSNPVLFDEFQDEDLCFDKKCFDLKEEAFTQIELSKIINEGLDVAILSNRKASDFIKDICKQFNVSELSFYEDYRTYKFSDWIPKKGFNVSGREIGKYEEVWVKPIQTKDGKPIQVSEDAKEQIQKIKTRASRALELDAEKIWAKVREIDNSKLTNSSGKLSNNEKVALVVAIGTSSWTLRKEIPFIENSNVENIKTEAITDQMVNLSIRKFIANKLMDSFGSHETSISNAAYKQVIEEYYPDKVLAIEKDQNEISEKRIEKTNQKIENLEQ